MKLKPIILAIILIGIGVWWWGQSPDKPRDIIQAMQINELGITYKNEQYQVIWDENTSQFSGDLRALLTEFNPYAPFNTHIAMVTNGDFSDPSQVIIKDAEVSINPNSKKTGEITGDITVIHAVPMNLSILGTLQSLKVNQKISFTGKQASTGRVQDSKGNYVNFGSNGKGRPLVLITEIQVL